MTETLFDEDLLAYRAIRDYAAAATSWVESLLRMSIYDGTQCGGAPSAPTDQLNFAIAFANKSTTT